MRYRYVAKEQEVESDECFTMYVSDKKKSTLPQQHTGYVESDNEAEATRLANRTIKKFAPNCRLIELYEVEE